MSISRYFATCARGLEPILAEELRALDASDIEAGRGGVHFSGDRSTLYRANLQVRTAIRILMPIHEAEVESPDDLYDEVSRVDWDRHMTPDHTLAVDANVRDSALTHSKYAALRVKDAICDQFVEREGRRPSVDVENPMVPLNLHVARNHMVLSLDSSGDSLHRRGYRPIQIKAPLNEALAAGLVLLTGWTGAEPFIDPMCGSGTLCVEAAWIALRRPPGLTRKQFGFMGWLDFDVRLWTKLRDEARARMRNRLPCLIQGSDVRRDLIGFAEGNAKAAGIGPMIRFAQKNIGDFAPPPGPAGVILCNPPYGERLDDTPENLAALYYDIGSMIRRCPGWKVFVFTSKDAPSKEIKMKPKRRVPLFNGKIACELLEYS